MFEKIKLCLKLNKIVKNIQKIFKNNNDKIEETKLILEDIKKDFERLISVVPEDKELILEILEQIKELKK